MKNIKIVLVLLCLFVLSLVIVPASADVISEGNATASDYVYATWDYDDYTPPATNTRTTASRFYIKYDKEQQPNVLKFYAYDVQVGKESAVRWYTDPSSPSAQVIPDSVITVVDVYDYYTSGVVGNGNVKALKIGSCDGTPTDAYGMIDLYFELTITNFSLMTGTGHRSLYVDIAGAGDPINDYYYIFYGQDYTTIESEMYASQGFIVGMVRDAGNNIFGLPGAKDVLGTCDHVDGWYVYSEYSFLNGYVVTTYDTNITVNVTREGDRFENYTVNSKVRSYDTNGLLLSESGWEDENETITLPLYGQYIYIVPDFGDGEHEITIASYEAENTSKIYGHVYNAINGTALNGVKISIDASHSTYSDSTGFYIIRCDPDTHMLHTSHDNYQPWVQNITFYTASNYEIDLYLLPNVVEHTGHGIVGTVYTLPYYQIVANQVVYIENSTWNSSTTSSSTGYYYFDDLETDDYWINATKSGYRNNNETVTVSSAGDVDIEFDNCDADTNWSSSNTLSVNTTDKYSGTGSLQSLGSNETDFNKTPPTAVNASTVDVENGYLHFWYKVNDSSRITSDLIVTIGSGGNNDTNKITCAVSSGLTNDTWTEIWAKLSDGTETGTLNMSNINWFEVKATKSDVVMSKIDDIGLYDFSYEIHDIDFDPILSFSVIAKTIEGNVISEFTATLDDETQNTSTGQTLTFGNLSFGVKDLTVTSSGYFPFQAEYYLDDSMSVTAYLQLQSGSDVQYEAHYVALRVVDWYYRAISGVSVTVVGNNATLINYTGTDGVAGFQLEQNIYYNITLTKDSQTKSISLMPVYNEYTIFFILTGQVPPQDTQNWYDYVDFTVTSENINSTYAYVNLTFSDNGTGSSNLYMFVNDSNDANLANTSNATLSVVVNHTQGSAFYVGFNCDYTGYDDGISVKKIVVFNWDLGDTGALTSYTRELMAIAFLIILAAVFGVLTVAYGALILPIFALILNYVGWFVIVDDTTTRMVCITALVLAIMYYMRNRDSEVG